MTLSTHTAQRVLITGATGAIGSALAFAYARPECELILQGRREAVLQAVAERCRDQGASVTICVLDLADEVKLFDWLETLRGEALPDLVIANAGRNTHAEAGEIVEVWPGVRELLAVNVWAPLAMANQLAPAMAQRGSGQFVFVSSLAAWHGLPVTPTYSASKAALKAYAEALRGQLALHGVGVSVVLPGYVRSRMADAMPGPKPWLWSPERAARVIRRGIERNRARIAFPLPMAVACQCLAVLPAGASQRILAWLGYGGRR